VTTNQATKRDLKFTPEIGIIPPHERVTVNVSSLDSAICTPNDAGNYCVWVHMFRAFCQDDNELKDFYSVSYPNDLYLKYLCSHSVW